MFSELCRRPESRRLPGTRRPDRLPRASRRLLLAGLLAATTAATTAPATTAARAAAAPAAGAPTALAEPWDGRFFTAAPAELLAAATAASAADDGRPVAVLFFENRYSFDEAGRLSHTSRMVYRVKSASADPSWSEAGIGWLPWHQQRPRMRARVVTPDGQEHRLDPKVLEQSTVGGGDPEMFSERQVLRGPLPAIGPGAVVEEEETVDDSAPAFEHGTLERQHLGLNVPVRHARIVLEAPAAMPLRYVVELPPDRPATSAATATTATTATTAIPPITPRRETSSGRQRLVFELRDVPPLAPPLPGLPPEAPRQPGIAFANGASWRDIAEAYSGIVDRAAAGAQLADWLRAAGAFDAAGSQLETVQRVLAHMTGIRYTGVELGEGSFVPRSPAETLGRRFGDCKDKAVLLVAALRALDIPAYVALLAAGEDDPDVDPALPGFGAFDHAIVYVPGTPALWIDPTDPYARLGELPASDQGRQALVAAPGVAALTRTPASAAAENRVLKTREFFLADSGPARVVETIEYGGAAEEQQRARYASLQPDALHKEIDDYAQRVFLGKAAAAFEHSDARDLSQPLRRRLEVREARRGYTDSASAVVAVLYSALFDLMPDDLTADDEKPAAGDAKPAAGEAGRPELRRTDYYFDLPHTIEVRYRIVPPAGFVPDELPASRVRQLGTATLSEQYGAAERGVTTATLRLDSGKQRISPAELAALRSALAQLVKERSFVLQFRQVGESEAAAGHIREALEEFRREAAAEPAKALPHLRMARALLAGGLGEAARRETELAIKLEPRSAAAYQTLGWVLQHDAIGRQFGHGFSRDQALAAYGRSMQLDPGLTAARAEYAMLLEVDPLGHHYLPGSDLPGAIAQYRTLRQDFDEQGFDDNLLVDLLYAGRPGEALALAGTMKDSENKPAVTAAATALEKGAEAAVHEVESTVEEPSRRWHVLEVAANTLVRLRAYATAAALLERAGPMSPDAPKLLAQAAVLRKARRLDEIPLPAGEPSTVARRALISFAREGSDPEQLLGILSEHLIGGTTGHRGEFLDEMRKVQQQVRKKIRETTSLPADLAMELSFAAMKENVSGDDQVGYRIDYSTVVGGEVEEYFVVPEGGGYRIAAVSTTPPTLGREALRRLAAGDLAGARQWLDWAREVSKEPAGDLRLPPFSALWTRGAAADAEPTRCAAAALAIEESEDEALPILRACRTAATTAERQVALDAALAAAALKQKRWEELRDAAQRLGAARPQAEEPFDMETLALRRLGRTTAIADLANRRLASLPADRRAALVLAEVAVEQGDLDDAERRFRTLAGAPGAGVEELNSLAWLLLVRGHADEQALELAQRAAQQPRGKTHAVLHTLGALLAERGRTSEAYQVMTQAINAADEPVPEEADWYVFGRMAEQYGLPDVARGLYARVEKPAGSEAFSTYHLAQARLAALGAPAPPVPAAPHAAASKQPAE
jgi:transglutaminase-like putative cysteine protease/Tfp pilus assembly protein PilF